MMAQIVFRKPFKLWPKDTNARSGGGEADRTMRRGGEAVPEGRLQQTSSEELAYSRSRESTASSQGFARATIHEIGMDENAGIMKRRRNPGGLIDRDALLHLFE
ncbi:MAG: hypothetical protein U0361_05080 [Nitrospiraceae bacterium]